MGIEAILFNGAEPFEEIVNMWNLKKMCQAVSEKKTFKDFMILYLYIAKGQEQITPGVAKFWS